MIRLEPLSSFCEHALSALSDLNLKNFGEIHKRASAAFIAFWVLTCHAVTAWSANRKSVYPFWARGRFSRASVHLLEEWLRYLLEGVHVLFL
jgi:hypothetical protein